SYTTHATTPIYTLSLHDALPISLTAAKPLHLDNTDFPAVAKRTAETGIPVYYQSEDNPSALGLFHPPLYIYSLAAWMRIFGASRSEERRVGKECRCERSSYQ